MTALKKTRQISKNGINISNLYPIEVAETIDFCMW